MKRVMIVGQPGAGKSFLAREIGRRTGLPVHHMDQIHWLPGWVERDHAEKLRLAHEVETSDRWVFEGGMSATYDHRLSRADHLVVLDFPLWLRAWRVFCRTLRDYGRSRPDLPEGCPEQFDFEFWQWIWDTRHKNRLRIRALLDRAGPHVTCHHLTTRRHVRHFLKTLDSVAQPGQETAHAALDH